MNFRDSNCICIEKYARWKLYDGVIEHDNGSTAIFAKRWSFLEETDRFTKEIQMLVKFKHNNIIGLVGYCQDMNELIVVYEHASNGSLNQHFDDNRLTWKKRLKICIDVATVLELLHEGDEEHGGTQFVHGNLGIDGILLDYDWSAKVTNFEYSVTVGKQNKYYDRVGKRCDIYSLCLILIRMLCGRLALEGCKDVDDFLVQHYKKNGNLDEMIFEGIKGQIVPESLITFQSLIMQCLDDELDAFPQASDMVMQLKKALKFQVSFYIFVPKLQYPLNILIISIKE